MAEGDWLSALTNAYGILVHFLRSLDQDQQLKLFSTWVAYLMLILSVRSLTLRLLLFLAMLWLATIMAFPAHQVRERPVKASVVRLVFVI